MQGAHLFADFCRNLRLLQRGVPLSAEVLDFCRKGYTFFADFCRNLRFLHKFAESVPLSAISAERGSGTPFADFCREKERGATFCRSFRFLQRDAHFLQKFKISAEICRKCAPFCRFLQKEICRFLQKDVHLSVERHTFCRFLQKS